MIFFFKFFPKIRNFVRKYLWLSLHQTWWMSNLVVKNILTFDTCLKLTSYKTINAQCFQHSNNTAFEVLLFKPRQNFKSMAKYALLHIPVIGWQFWLNDYVIVKRKLEEDKATLEQCFKKYKKNSLDGAHFWVWINLLYECKLNWIRLKIKFSSLG